LTCVHIDIKPDNIFVKFRDYSRIRNGYLAQTSLPQQNRSEEHYTVIPFTSPPHPLHIPQELLLLNLQPERPPNFGIALGD
jgi:serine/threonine-protein kinase SRPK3